MRILHTESSNGWGGQEIRILREALGLEKRGFTHIFAVQSQGGLVSKARAQGIQVFEIDFKRPRALAVIWELIGIIQKEKIDLIVTHSSLDAWLGGIAARLKGIPVVRMRHLSTKIRPGLNSFLLYKKLADRVVTTSSPAKEVILRQAKLSPAQCLCVPTGVEPGECTVQKERVEEFRKSLNLQEGDLLVGTACFVRSWKGVKDLLQAAALLKQHTRIKWVVIGGGYVEEYKPYAKELNLQESVTFTGHLENPFPAIAALDIFTLLSTAHEGISQASLQAAFLEKPLITTDVGGLPEVCISQKTGLLVSPFSPKQVADAVLQLVHNPSLRKEYGQNAKRLVEEKFSFKATLDQMEEIYRNRARTRAGARARK